MGKETPLGIPFILLTMVHALIPTYPVLVVIRRIVLGHRMVTPVGLHPWQNEKWVQAGHMRFRGRFFSSFNEEHSPLWHFRESGGQNTARRTGPNCEFGNITEILIFRKELLRRLLKPSSF